MDYMFLEYHDYYFLHNSLAMQRISSISSSFATGYDSITCAVSCYKVKLS